MNAIKDNEIIINCIKARACKTNHKNNFGLLTFFQIISFTVEEHCLLEETRKFDIIFKKCKKTLGQRKQNLSGNVYLKFVEKS